MMTIPFLCQPTTQKAEKNKGARGKGDASVRYTIVSP